MSLVARGRTATELFFRDDRIFDYQIQKKKVDNVDAENAKKISPKRGLELSIEYLKAIMIEKTKRMANVSTKCSE